MPQDKHVPDGQPSTPIRQGDLVRRYGPWALVTGASDGIGLAFAEQLAAAGFSLVLVARRGALLDALAVRLSGQYQVQCVTMACDLSEPGAALRLLARTADHEIGLLVASAGFGTSGPFLDSDLATELSMIDLNCRAVAEQVHVFGQAMKARGRGGIILLSSLVAFQGVPRSANYAATKGFVQCLAEGLRLELRPAGIDVLAVAPGPIASGFAKRAGLTMGLAQTPDIVARGALAALGRATTVRPGWLAKLLETSLSPLPRFLRTRIMQQVMAGMTR